MAGDAATQDGGISTGVAAGGLAIMLLPVAVLSLIVAVMVAAVSAIQNPANPLDSGLGGDPYAVEHFGAMYKDAAAVYKVSPYVLMAVHEDESNYGRSTLPGVRDGVNEAGCCAGPTQFSISSDTSNSLGGSGATWEGYRDAYKKAKLKRPADYPNRFEPHPNVYDSFDAIYATAAYLHELGAGPKLDARTFTALLSYTGTPPASIPYAITDYKRAKELEKMAPLESPLQNGLAIDDTKPRTPERVLAVANWIEKQNLPYCWGGGHGTPGPSAGSWCTGTFESKGIGLDCSGAVRWLLLLSGYPDPGGRSSYYYGSYLKPGPGKHITFWYGPPGKIGHIYATIDGQVWEASTGAPDQAAGWSRPRSSAGYVAGHVEGL